MSKVDGVVLTSAQAAFTSGSTIVTLQPAFLSSLTVGTHTLTSMFNDDTVVEVTFQIAPASATPKTGDNAALTIVLTFALAICAMLTLLFGAGALRSRSRQN